MKKQRKSDGMEESRRVLGRDDKIIQAIGYVVIGIFAVFCVLPFYLIIVASFTEEDSLIRNGYPCFSES